jgi:AraC-like DNA-binding protein
MDNRDILENYRDIVREKRDVNDLHTELLNCVCGGKINDLKEIFARSDFCGVASLMDGSDINFASAVFEFLLPQMARAAVEGGVNEMTAAAVYLNYKGKAARVASGRELQKLLKTSFLEYAEMVAALKNKNLPVLARRCHEYIAAHLYEPITVNAIAQKFRMSRSYLSHAYKAACGETIVERIHKEKIAAAEVLLTYSRHSLVEIALELGFSSQSHFTQVFSKERGITPHQYLASKKAQI